MGMAPMDTSISSDCLNKLSLRLKSKLEYLLCIYSNLTNSRMSHNIIIIGAGVIGAASALALQKKGYDVLLIDRDAPCSGASFGNAGAIVNGSCEPTAMPGIVLDVIKMLGQPNPSVSINPKYLHKILPWIIRFILQSRRSAVNANAKHLSALSKQAVMGWQTLLQQTRLATHLKNVGWLKVYETEKSFNATRQHRQILDNMDVGYELLNAGQIRDLEPNLASIFNYGFYQNDSLHIPNPETLVKGMVELFTAQGGSYQQFAVNKIEISNQSVQLTGTNEKLTADKVIIAAGAWSRSLAIQLGDKIPLETERGYHLMMPESTAGLLKRPVVNGEDSFVLSPMDTGLRLISQVELSGLYLPPDYRPIRRLLPLAKRMLPCTDTREESVWMGFRPSLPDSLPVMGFSSKSNKVLYAFGHQHLGITLGGITALIIAELIVGQKTAIPVYPYRADRFSNF